MRKSLASLALIKANWDLLARDYIENYIPFILALIARKKYAEIDVNTLCSDFTSEFGLSIPYHPMISILQRVAKRGFIERRRSDRKYCPVYGKIGDADFTDRANEQESKYIRVLDDFVSYCKREYDEEISRNEAEDILISFLKDHDLDILFLNKNGEHILPDPGDISIKDKYLINSYIKDLYEKSSNHLVFLVDISIGHIISNTLLCENYENYQNSLKNCNLYLDIGFLFSILGINGPEKKDVYRECIKLLLSNKARLFVFKHTYEEFKTILDGCLNWIASHSYDISRANRALIFFIENGYSESDVEEFILNVERELAQMSIVVADAPSPKEDSYYQIDDEVLQRVIERIYRDREPHEHTILLDIKSIASIYKFRKGTKPRTLREAGHVLVTTNNSLAYASLVFDREEYSKEERFGIPTVITDVFAGTILWINKPNAASINKKRLIANCYAALLPSRALLKKLLDAADRLKARGEITDEQVILLKESRIARNLLSKETLGDPDRFTDKTPGEILEEIKSEVRKEEREKFTLEKQRIENRLAEAQQKVADSKEGIEVIRDQADALAAIKAKLDESAKKSVRRRIWTIGVSYAVLWLIYGIAKIFFNLGFLEKAVYFLGAWPIIHYFYFVVAEKEFSPREIYEKLLQNRSQKNYKAFGFNLERYRLLKRRQEELKLRLDGSSDAR